MRKTILSFILCTIGFLSCSNELETLKTEELQTSNGILKGGWNKGYFDWDTSDVIIYKDKQGKETQLSLPWLGGSTSNLGIPDDWIDPKAHDKTFTERAYHRDKGWVLTYSNLHDQSQAIKYFALYNKYTGILRFFYYATGSVSESNSNSIFIGLNMNKSTSSFNFTTPTATPNNQPKASPGYLYAPQVDLTNGTTANVGFAIEQWYGLEIEMAYDPNSDLSNAYFKTVAWTARTTKISGSITTTGSINGTITSSSSNNPGLTLDFGKSNSNSMNTYNLDKESTANILGSTIEEGVKAEEKANVSNGFFKQILSNLKSNASKWVGSGLESGITEGIKAIMSGGASAVSDAFNGLVGSLLGTNNETSSKIDLKLKAESVVNLEAITEIVQFKISPFPVAGSNSTDPPYYNERLGVWNLERSPQINIELYNYHSNSASTSFSHYSFILEDNTPILLNPVLKGFEIRNVKQNILIPANHLSINGDLNVNPELVDLYKYSNRYKVFTTKNLPLQPYGILSQFDSYLVRVSFDLYDKNTNKTHSFMKCFKPNFTITNTINQYNNGSGGDDGDDSPELFP